MTETLRTRTKVKTGGVVQVILPDLQEGEEVDVTVGRSKTGVKPSIMDVLAEAPGHLVFQTAEEVDDYVRRERMGRLESEERE